MSRSYFGLREYRRRLAEREAKGESLWTESLNEATRTKLVHVINSFMNHPNLHYHLKDKLPDAVQAVSYQMGIISLSSAFNFHARSAHEETVGAILSKNCKEDVIFSLLEAFWDILHHYPNSTIASPRDDYTNSIRLTLEDCRISYDFVEGNIIPRGEQEMHVEVVVPAVTLLSRRSGFEDAERNYMDALTSIREQRFDDAVTNAASAVEATLRILDCGDTQTPLAKRGAMAIERNLLAPHDRGLLGWITATRGSEGDAHGQGSHTTRADAWLVVHVAGALILRLVDGPNRGLGS